MIASDGAQHLRCEIPYAEGVVLPEEREESMADREDRLQALVNASKADPDPSVIGLPKQYRTAGSRGPGGTTAGSGTGRGHRREHPAVLPP